MRIAGTAYNGSDGSAAEGAVVTLRAPAIDGSTPLVYSTFVGSDGTWSLSIPGTPGTNSTLTIAFQGRTRILSTRQLQLGMTPSWSPYWMSALAHRNGAGVSRGGVTTDPEGGFRITQTGPSTLSISAGCVAHTDFDSDDNYWMASWSSATSFSFQQFTQSTNSYGSISSGETWMLGVERLSDGRCVFQVASLSGTTGTTPQATYSNMVGGFNDNFIPLAQVVRSGSSITSITSYRNYLYEGRVAGQPILSVTGGSTGTPYIYDGVDSDSFDSSTLTITTRSAGDYMVDGKVQVMTYETGAVPYWAASSFGSVGSGNTNFDTPGQIARDSSGNIYVADTGNGRIKKHQADGTYTAATGSGAVFPPDIPRGVAIDPSGNVYVSVNATGGGGTFAGSIYKLDVSLAYVASWGFGDGLIGHVATDGTYVYVANAGLNKIYRLPVSLASQTNWGSAGSGDGQLNTPVGIATDGTYVYVVDQGNKRVQKFTTAGAFVAKWGTSGTGDGQFTTPVGIAVNPASGNILVTDTGRDDVQEFTNTGTFVRKFSSLGSGNGQVNNPTGIVVSADGSVIYVADQGNDRINVFTYTTPPDGLDWYDLQVEMFYKINAGSWTSMGSKNVPNFSVMPDYWNFSEDSTSVTLAAGDTIQFRVTVSNTDTGSLAWDTMNYVFRLRPLGSQ